MPAKPHGWGRWHPSRATEADRRRIREWSEDFHRWMFGGLFALLYEIAAVESRDAGHPHLRPMHLILTRRLEAA